MNLEPGQKVWFHQTKLGDFICKEMTVKDRKGDCVRVEEQPTYRSFHVGALKATKLEALLAIQEKDKHMEASTGLPLLKVSARERLQEEILKLQGSPDKVYVQDFPVLYPSAMKKL